MFSKIFIKCECENIYTSTQLEIRYDFLQLFNNYVTLVERYHKILFANDNTNRILLFTCRTKYDSISYRKIIFL